MGLLSALKKKKAQIDKLDEIFYLPEDIDKNDQLWQLRTINDIIIAMCGRMTRKSEFGENMGALSAEERVFYVVTDIYSQVNSMGFEHYYFDEAGRHAMEAAEALRTIGADARAEIVEKAMEIIGGTLPEDDKERANYVRHNFTDDMRNALMECDKQFRELDDDINRLLFVYIREYHYKFTEA